MKKLLFYSILFALIMGCKEDDDIYEHIDENCYFLINENDTIFFDSKNKTDTLIIKGINQFYLNVDWIYSDYIETIRYSYYNYVDSTQDIIYRDTRRVTITWDYIEYSFLYEYTEYSNYAIGCYLFDYVYILENDSGEGEDIHKIYYTDKYGVIAYELYNGELFEIDVERFPAHVELP